MRTKEEIAAYKKQYSIDNKEKIAQYKAEYYQKNKEKIEEQSKANKEAKAIYMKQWREKNKERLTEYQKQYISTNRGKISEYNKQFRIDNPEKVTEQERRYNKKRYKNNPQYFIDRVTQWAKDNPDRVNMKKQRRKSQAKQLPNTFTIEEWEDAKAYFGNKCCYCGDETTLQQEHFIPLSKGGWYTVQNIIPACKSCNCSKNDSDFFKWYPRQEYYSKDRENKIIRYLNYKNTTVQQLSILIK